MAYRKQLILPKSDPAPHVPFGPPTTPRIVRVNLKTAEDRFPDHHISGAVAYVDHYWQHHQGNAPIPMLMSKDYGIRVVVNHGRWMVLCPDDTCQSAQLASKKDHRFLCVECGNSWAGGVWISVEWPKEADHIERILGSRLSPHNRSWWPGETVQDLQEENDRNGVR